MEEQAVQTGKDIAAQAAAAGWFNLAHVLGALMYVGGLLTVSAMMSSLVKLEPPMRAGGAVSARKAYFSCAFPGLLLLLGAGVYTLIMDPQGKQFFSQGYFHMKLGGAVFLLAVDHMLVMRPLKALTREDLNIEGQEGLYKAGFWMVTLLVLVVLAALYIIRKT
ncbi:MAG TPA: hypothetical protein VFS92_05445 [Planctomycetota bacterium]|nr:hypothetical protein [Planctomycetota bacterium]